MPSTSAIPIPANTKPTASESLFPSFLKKRTKYVKSIPKTAPIPSAPIISTIGEKIILTTDTFAVELSIPATATAIPKSISAAASSRATTDKSVSVTGPFALYWRITIMVAAGAVAAAIELKTIENDSSLPIATSTAHTATTAPRASSAAMTIGAAPTFLKYDILNSLPIENAIKPSATSLITAIESIVSFGIILSTLGPKTRPARRYPVTLGSLTSFTRRPNAIPEKIIIAR